MFFLSVSSPFYHHYLLLVTTTTIIIVSIIIKLIDLFWERESKQERVHAGEEPCQRGPNTGLELTNCEIMTWPKIKSQTRNQLSRPGIPYYYFCCYCYIILLF